MPSTFCQLTSPAVALGESLGFDHCPVVASIVRLERANRFKRRLMLIARLSGSAINLDREIPRD